MAKIADVGLAKMLTNADQYSLDHTAGTFAYAAPELILGTRCSEKVSSLYVMTAQTRLQMCPPPFQPPFDMRPVAVPSISRRGH